MLIVFIIILQSQSKIIISKNKFECQTYTFDPYPESVKCILTEVELRRHGAVIGFKKCTHELWSVKKMYRIKKLFFKRLSWTRCFQSINSKDCVQNVWKKTTSWPIWKKIFCPQIFFFFFFVCFNLNQDANILCLVR